MTSKKKYEKFDVYTWLSWSSVWTLKQGEEHFLPHGAHYGNDDIYQQQSIVISPYILKLIFITKVINQINNKTPSIIKRRLPFY